MRIPIGEQWIELKDIADLSAADDDAYQRVITEAALAARGSEVEITEEDEGEVSGDGVSVTPRKHKLTLTVEMIERRRDDLLGRLITGWSYDIPLPYNAASRELLPRAAGKALAEAVKPYQRELNDAGPKEATTEPAASTSANGSAAG